MLKTIKTHLHPLGGHILFWNIALLVFVKIILPHATFPLATILEQAPLFNSREVITLTNEVRINNNLPALKPNFQLDSAANAKLNDMIKNNYFAHVSPSGVTPWFWIKNSSYTYNVAGENLAIGFFTAKDTVDAWLKSPSHKANLLNTKYQDIGIAVGKANINGHQGIVVVQMFGLPSKVSAVAVAQPTPVQTVLAQIPSVSPDNEPASQIVAAAETVSESSIQTTTTDETAIPVRQPLAMNNLRGEEITNIVSSTNIAFMFYALTMAIISIVAVSMINRSKFMMLKSLAHVNIFLMAVLISAAEIYISASVF